MDSIDSNPDLELIAALIDGRLSGEERARAIKLLADSDEALELFANALQDRQATSDVKVVPIATARSWRRWKVVVPVAAAAVLAVIIVPGLANREGPVSGRDYAMELTRDPRFASGLRPGWEQRGWAVTRGAPSREVSGTQRARSVLESRLAFRLGARTVDLQIALRRGDTALAGRLASEIQETLNGLEFSQMVGARYADLRSRLSTETLARSIDRATSVERELRDLLDSPSFAFGQWVGAADLAAQAHDASFFESSHGARFIQSTTPADSLAAEDIDALRAIDARMKQGLTDPALDEIHEVLQTIIRRRGG